MIKLKIELQSGIKKVSMPMNWDEIDLATLVRIETEFQYKRDNIIKLFSILTGIEMDILSEASGTDIDIQLLDICRFIWSPPKWKDLPPPKTIILGSRKVECKYDFKTTTLGQKLLMDQIIHQYDSPIEAFPEVISVFLQPTIDGKFDLDKARALLPDIKKLSAEVGYSYGQFFFLRSRNLKRFGLKGLGSPAQRIRTMLNLQGIRNSKHSQALP